MELGACVCTYKSPDCAHCPVAATCKARAECARDIEDSADAALLAHCSGASDDVCTICAPLPAAAAGPCIEDFPMAKTKKAPRREAELVLVVRWQPDAHAGDSAAPTPLYLLLKRPALGLLAGMWSFPAVPLPNPTTAAAAADEDDDTDTSALPTPSARTQAGTTALAALLPCLSPRPAPSSAIPTRTNTGPSTTHISARLLLPHPIPHIFTHISMLYHVELVTLAGGTSPPALRDPRREHRWLLRDELDAASIGTGFKRVLVAALALDDGAGGKVGVGKGTKKRKQTAAEGVGGAVGKRGMVQTKLFVGVRAQRGL